MSTLGIVLLVVFIVISVFLVLLVVIQDDGENGMGGLLGGRSTAAFGSHSASVLSKATGVFAFLFISLAVVLAVVNKKESTDSIIESIESTENTDENVEEIDENKNWWGSEEEASTGNLELNDNIDLSNIDLSNFAVPLNLPEEQ